jgi:DNA replication protein DnaC
MKENIVLTHATIEGLKSLRLPAMAAGLAQQREHPDYASLSFEERLGLLVDAELLQRQNRRLERVLKAAKLRSSAVVEDVDFTKARGLDKAAFAANHAIRQGHSALYVRVPRLLDDLSVARADGRLARVMSSLARTDVVILDDLLLRPLSDDQAADLLEVVEDRRGRSIIATSQLPINHWHEGLGDATVADAIMDRLLQRTHRIELSGASRRREKTTASEPE